MTRAKEFEREEVLKEAVPMFAHGGYAGTSTSVLLRAMGISRQSMYDTFGDKRSLYLEALRHHLGQTTSRQLDVLNADASPIRKLHALLRHVVTQAFHEQKTNCLSISSICEFGYADEEINRVVEAARMTLLTALEACISDAKSSEELDEEIDVRHAALFIATNFSGIEIAARGGASQTDLEDIANLVIRNLK